MATLSGSNRPCRATIGDASVAVTWVAPDAASHRRKLDAVCDLIGPAILDLRLSKASRVSGPSGLPAADAVAVATWNTHMGSGHLDAFVQELSGGPLTGHRRLPIVLLLQEARRTGLRETAAALDLSLIYAPAMPNERGSDDRGNAILTSLPLGDVVLVELPFERQRRVAIVATVEGHGPVQPWALRVASVHLETRTSIVRGSPAAARARQARALIGALGASAIPTVIGGDLNASWGEDEPAIRALREAFPDAKPADRPLTFAGPFGLRAPLDYIFARGTRERLDVRRVGRRFGSDHHPVVTVVNMAR
jgi:endonuclease/exonuclease/phosphatase family metal-dependent hydrolase